LLGQAPWPATPARAQDAEPQWRHSLSLFSELKYSPGFRHFDYVNPQAPKGGTLRLAALGTFDNFNRVVAGQKGLFAAAEDQEARSIKPITILSKPLANRYPPLFHSQNLALGVDWMSCT
jgi:hypothetical protein